MICGTDDLEPLLLAIFQSFSMYIVFSALVNSTMKSAHRQLGYSATRSRLDIMLYRPTSSLRLATCKLQGLQLPECATFNVGEQRMNE